MNLVEISKAHWSSYPAQEAAANLVRGFLADAPVGSNHSTSAVLRALGVHPQDMQAFSSKLTNARANGLLNEGVHFKRGKPNAGTYGKQSIVWTACGAAVEDSDEITTAEIEAAQAEADRLVAETKRKALDTLPKKAST